jgi:chemotaxis response regulator CheB
MLLKRIRILLWGMPSMLLDIISDAIAPHPDMDIVGKGAKAATLFEAAERTNADVVILVRKGVAENEGYDELLYRHSRLKVIEISGEGHYGSLYELRPRHLPLGEMSPPRLVDAIRESVNRAAGAEL